MDLKDKLKSALIIEPQSLTQNYLKISLRNLGFNHLDIVDRASIAIKSVANRNYSLILCSSELKSGPDGFQLFEHLVKAKLVRASSCFVFLSAENSLAQSQSVLELKPDDFILKPFSAKEIEMRLKGILSKKVMLNDVYREMDKENYDGANNLLNKHISKNVAPKYIPYYMKLKGELLLLLNEWSFGKDFFSKVCDITPHSWAQLGLVKCLIELGELDTAKDKLELMVKNPQIEIKAYDLLAELYQKYNEFDKAAKHLKIASTLSPRNVDRLQELVTLSRLLHDFETQSSASNSIVRQLNNSVHNSPEYYLSAARSNVDYGLTTMNDEEVTKIAQVSQSILGNLRKNFPEESFTEQMEVVQARILNLRNEKEKAKKILSKFISRLDKNLNYISCIEDGLDQAKAFHELGFHTQSQQLFEDLVNYSQLSDSDPILMQYINEEQQLRIEIKESPKELNNKAVGYFQIGKYRRALQSFEMAYKLMPRNPSIALNLMQTVIESDSYFIDDQRLMALISDCKNTIANSQLNVGQRERYDKLNEMLEQRFA